VVNPTKLDAVVLVVGGLAGWLAVAAGIVLRRPVHGGIYAFSSPGWR
jgi:hypothetical protein